ncbi:MAG: hypothetical protein PHQ59_00430 [Candidatus Daviesbacteria bacterium]|nr:hypothetical protein [Candidatus Daviesbacteria bacterium]
MKERQTLNNIQSCDKAIGLAVNAVLEEVHKVGDGFGCVDLPFPLSHRARLGLYRNLHGSLRNRVVVVSEKEAAYITIIEKRK